MHARKDKKSYMSPEDWKYWKEQINLSWATVGRLLGLSHKTVYRYKDGEQPTPRYIALACRALLNSYADPGLMRLERA